MKIVFSYQNHFNFVITMTKQWQLTDFTLYDYNAMSRECGPDAVKCIYIVKNTHGRRLPIGTTTILPEKIYFRSK